MTTLATEPQLQKSAAADYQTDTFRFGVGGVDLRSSLDAIGPNQASRLTNVVAASYPEAGRITGRVGQTSLATGGGGGSTFHSVIRAADPLSATTSRVWGIGTGIYYGASGALTLTVAGGSGNPFIPCAYRPPLSGQSWIFCPDTTRVLQKVRASDGLTLAVGLAAPGAAATTALAAELTTTIENFETGFAAFGVTGGVPTLSYPAGKDVNCLNMLTVVGAATGPYGSAADKALALDLSLVGGATASDDDLIHLWLRMDRPDRIAEVRIYLICSAFTSTVLPGASTTQNTDAFVYSFRPSDLTQFVEDTQGTLAAASQRQARDQIQDQLEQSGVRDRRPGGAGRADAQRDPARQTSAQQAAGRNVWTEFGVVGVPLRRGDFLRIGNDSAADWNTITGITVFVQTSTNQAVNVQFDQMFLRGGRGADSSEPGSSQYDWKVTNYDPRTGAESNGSPVQATANFLDVLRRRVTVTPAAAYGDAAIRQRVYRRGGSSLTTDNWYFAGVNAADGGAFSDDFSDLTLSTAGTIPIDHFQPVPTIDAAGATVLNAAVSAVWGPVEDYLFACGTIYQPGHVFYCLSGQPDHWFGSVEVCSPSERLMAGWVWGDSSWTHSTERLYRLIPNLSNGTVSSVPTTCKKGLIGRWAYAAGLGGMYFVGQDGVYRTDGGDPQLISQDIDPLFRGETRHGYSPIDKTAEDGIRLEIVGLELWLLFRDTLGASVAWIYNLLEPGWRHYSFARAPQVVYGEPVSGITIIGGRATGAAYTHTGTTDDSVAIASLARTGARTQGLTRAVKTYGDLALDANRNGLTLTVEAALDDAATTLAAVTITTGSALQRYPLDPFGTTPSQAINLTTEVRWSSSGNQPTIRQLAISYLPHPELIVGRITEWDDLGSGSEKYLWGITLDVDTFNVAKTVVVEGTLETGVVTTIDTLTFTANGRRKVTLSWASAKVSFVRLRPTDADPWQLFGYEWLATPEPPRTAKWDSGLENLGDTYYTGLSLELDTLNVAKTIEVYVDGTLISTQTVTANGRQVKHLAFGSTATSYGHIYQFKATDANPGLLYSHKWHAIPQPPEQINFDLGYDNLGNPAPKFIAGVDLECDTQGATKVIEVYIDGILRETLPLVNTLDHGVYTLHFPGGPYYGRVCRLKATDGAPGRLHVVRWLFEQEPDESAGFGVQNWSELSSVSDKLVKGVVLVCDTGNRPKVVQVLGDGILKKTIQVQANGRQSLQFSWEEFEARTVRLNPTDIWPGKLYARQWIFNVEPLKLQRWESDWTDHGLKEDHSIRRGYVTYRSLAGVTYTLTLRRGDGSSTFYQVFLPATGGGKVKVPLESIPANKGLLFRHKFEGFGETSFHLYREESCLYVLTWQGQETVVHPFGSDDLDPSRNMGNAELAAAKPGGAL